VAKASTRTTNHGGKASARSKLEPTRLTAAKHPPDRNGGKASASEENPTNKRELDDADEMKRKGQIT